MQRFKIDIPQSEIDDLRGRIAATRWASDLNGVGWSRGVPENYLRRLAEYWLNDYDWRTAEAELNSYPQYTTNIDGASVHFLHIRSPEPKALPLIITHGWPGSVAEFLKVIGPLTDPASFGGDLENAFDLVIPSIPGFGFSGPVGEAGWNIPRIARAWAELMRRLGYDRYGAQGGDFGSPISLELGRTDRNHVVGVHTNMLAVFPSGDPAELRDLDAEDQARLARLTQFDTDGSGYLKLLSTRPQTVGYAMTDSPVGLLAWLVERFKEWISPAIALEEAIDRDQMLTNVMIYWLTGTSASSSQLYYEVLELQKRAAAKSGDLLGGYREEPIEVPVGVAVFPHDCFVPVRRLAERNMSTIIQWNEFDVGGHFPAMEVPELYINDVRSFFGSLSL